MKFLKMIFEGEMPITKAKQEVKKFKVMERMKTCFMETARLNTWEEIKAK